MNRLKAGLVVLTGLVWLVGPPGVEGHAFLERADPRVGGTVRTAPTEVRLWFTEGLEPAFSSVRVVNAAGQQVDRGDSRVDPSNPALLRISLSPLPPGTYKVFWRALSVDTHVTEGDFTFRIVP